jgi:hypothetical protein
LYLSRRNLLVVHIRLEHVHLNIGSQQQVSRTQSVSGSQYSIHKGHILVQNIQSV